MAQDILHIITGVLVSGSIGHGREDGDFMDIEFPIFILEKDCGDISKFGSVSEMQMELEKIDVENKEYDAWDKKGIPLKLTVHEPEWLRIEAGSGESEAEKVKELIRALARRAGVDFQGEQSHNLVDLFDSVNTRISKRR